MESQPQNPEFRNNTENFHPWDLNPFLTLWHNSELTFFKCLILIPTLAPAGSLSKY